MCCIYFLLQTRSYYVLDIIIPKPETLVVATLYLVFCVTVAAFWHGNGGETLISCLVVLCGRRSIKE